MAHLVFCAWKTTKWWRWSKNSRLFFHSRLSNQWSDLFSISVSLLLSCRRPSQDRVDVSESFSSTFKTSRNEKRRPHICCCYDTFNNTTTYELKSDERIKDDCFLECSIELRLFTRHLIKPVTVAGTQCYIYLFKERNYFVSDEFTWGE